MRILILDNSIDRDCWGAPEYRALIPRDASVTVTVRRGPHGDLPATPAGFDRVLATGSRTSCLSDAPWVDREIAFIRATLDAGIPYLGICFGHQLLVRALGGTERLRKAQRGEHGWIQVERASDESGIFRGLPAKFWSFGSHDEEAATLPPELRVTARSERCGIQAVELAGKPAWGVQFHPEKDLDQAARSFAERRKTRAEALNAARSRELYDPAVGTAIVRGWLASG